MSIPEYPHIRYVTPYDLDKNIADAYNDEMNRAFADEYIAFVDRDTWWPDPFFGTKIAEIVADNPNAAFTCLTNRTNCRWQRWIGSAHVDCMEQHIEIQHHVWKLYEHSCRDHTDSQLWSGHLMVIPKNMWIPLERRGLLGVDNDIHENIKKQGGRILLMAGIFLPHWYSGYTGELGNKERDKSHLI